MELIVRGDLIPCETEAPGNDQIQSVCSPDVNVCTKVRVVTILSLSFDPSGLKGAYTPIPS